MRLCTHFQRLVRCFGAIDDRRLVAAKFFKGFRVEKLLQKSLQLLVLLEGSSSALNSVRRAVRPVRRHDRVEASGRRKRSIQTNAYVDRRRWNVDLWFIAQAFYSVSKMRLPFLSQQFHDLS